jgi:hypothetical protein
MLRSGSDDDGGLDTGFVFFVFCTFGPMQNQYLLRMKNDLKKNAKKFQTFQI